MKRCYTELYALGRTIFLLFATWLSLARGDVMPSFLREPKTSHISHHATVTIYCEVAPSAASVKWLFNSKPLKPQEHTGLTFQETSLFFTNFEYSTNEGIYQCVASTTAGSIISEPLVLQKPVLKAFPTQSDLDITATLDGVVVIPCPATSSSPNSPQVLVKDSSGHLLDKTTDDYIRLPSGRILIKKVQQKHQGEYRCVTVNPLTNSSQTSEHVINLNIQSQAAGPDTVIVDDNEEKIFPWVGTSTLLECPVVSRGNPNVTWKKYGGRLPLNRSKVEYGNLRIDNVKIQDAGTYICHGTLSAKKKLIAMEVQELVSSTAVSTQINATAGERVELRCNVIGRPQPKVTWYHNAVQIARPSSISSGGAVFVIDKVAPSHTGLYQCQAKNNVSSDSDVMRLVVKGQGLNLAGKTDETTIGVTESDQGANNETTYENKVDATKPKKKKKNRKHRKKKGRRKGKKNKKKRKRKKDRLKDKVKLVPPSQPHVEQLSDTSVMLNWTVPQNDGLPITFFRVQYKTVHPSKDSWRTDDKEIDKDTTVYEVKNLKPGGVYKFRIAAVYSNNDNEVGQNSHRFKMNIAPAGTPGVPVDKPTIVEVSPLQQKENKKDVFGIGIKWQYMLSESSPIEGFFIEYKPYDSDEQWKQVTILETKVRSHVLTYLKADTEYSIRMRCFNSAGMSEYSNRVVKRTSAVEKSSMFPPFDGSDNDEDKEDNFGKVKKVNNVDKVDKQTPRNDKRPRDPTYDETEEDKPTDTHKSSEMLYMGIGIAMGVMLLLLIVFIVMCWWKQRQERQMMGMNGMIHAKFQDQAQRIYSESMRKKYMNGYPLNGLNGLVANGHVPHGNGSPGSKMNINVNPISELETQMSAPQPGKGPPNHALVPNGSVPHYSTSDNNFNSINSSKNRDEIPPDQPLLSETNSGDIHLQDPAMMQRLGQSSNSIQYTHPANHGHSSNEADMSSGEASRTSPRGYNYFSAPGGRLQSFDGGTSPPVFSARNTMDSLSPSDHISGNHGKHKRRRKRPHSREHATKDQATNTDLSSNEGTIEFTTFNKSPSPSSEKSQSFTNCATQCTDYTHMNGAL